MDLNLGKDKKLKSRKEIEALFTQRTSVRKGAIKAFYQLSDSSETNHKVGFSVSKRFFKKAPDRNRVKRLLREAYRLQQHDLKSVDHSFWEVMFVYQSHKIQDQATINRWMKGVIEALNDLKTHP